MNKHSTSDIEPRTMRHVVRNPQASQTVRRLDPTWPRAILVIDGALLVLAGFSALAADIAGYVFGAGPFVALASQPLTIGAVEAHGLAVLVGFLLMLNTPHDRWRSHVVALGVHLFLAVCNLFFWDVYAVMGAVRTGVLSTIAHAVLFGAQLTCLALANANSPAKLPKWLVSARRSGLYVRSVAITTLLLGAGTHIAVIVLGREAQPRILTPGFELLLAVPMFYVSIAGWLAWPTFRFHGGWHQVALGLILIYFPIGLPFHIITVTTGSTLHYAAFPEQYSLLIVPVMAAFIACFASLRLREPGHRQPVE